MEILHAQSVASILKGKAATYENLYSAFAKYCNGFEGQIHLCWPFLGGIFGFEFCWIFRKKLKTLVLIGTPYKVPKAAFCLNVVFRFLPKSFLTPWRLIKRYIALGNTMKNLDFSDAVKISSVPR